MQKIKSPWLAKKPVVPFLAVAANWAIISSCIAAGLHLHSWLISLLAIVVIGARQHALFVMIHEAAHHHISRFKFVNDWTADLLCAFPLLFDTDVYRKNHLAHHRHLNTEQDPDWVRKVGQTDWLFPMAASQFTRFVPRFILKTGPLEWGYILWRFSGFGEKTRWQQQPGFLLFKAAYFAGALALMAYCGALPAFLLYWIVPMFLVLPAVGRLRSIAEHFAVSYADDLNSTRDVRAGWLEGFLLAPHNVHFHLTHHVHPHIPFYNLPEAHRQICESGAFAGAHINGSYLMPFEKSVLADVLNGPATAMPQPLKKVS